MAAAHKTVGDERSEFDRRLESMGWDDADSDLYTAIWQLRSSPRSYLVQGDFPRITEELIADRVPSWPLVSDVGYRIDLTDYPHPSSPQALNGFVETKGEHS